MMFSVVVAAFATALAQGPATHAQTPPQPGYHWHDTSRAGPFTIERWVSDDTPDVSPAGQCDCVLIASIEGRRVVTLPSESGALSVDAISGRDVTGDGRPDLVISAWSGGAHCCYTTSIFSVGDTAQPVLQLQTGNCGPGELADLDGDGVSEFTTCDDQWAYAYCSFAESPLPRVVLAYDRGTGRFAPATPRFPRRSARAESERTKEVAEARAAVSAAGRDRGAALCAALGPVLDEMYSGRVAEGEALFRALYRAPDRGARAKEIIGRVRASALWVAR